MPSFAGSFGHQELMGSGFAPRGLQREAAPLALDSCPAGTPGTTPETGMLPGTLHSWEDRRFSQLMGAEAMSKETPVRRNRKAKEDQLTPE
jgi:hypothetical protein